MRLNRRSQSGFRRRHPRASCLSLIGMVLSTCVMIALGRAWVLRSAAPITGEATLMEAESAFQNGDLGSAVQISTQLVERDGRDFAALALLVRALVVQSESDFVFASPRITALNYSTAAIARFSTQSDVMGIHAFALQANGQYDAAVVYALRAIDRDKGGLPARLALAIAYSSTGLFDAGLREADKAVSLSLNDASYAWDASRVRGITLSQLGRYQDALAQAEQAIAINRHLIPTYFERALYAQQMGNQDVATASWYTIVALEPNNVKARYRLCELSSRLREVATALRFCTEVTELSPQFAQGWYALGREYYYDGNFRQAQQALLRCSTLEVQQQIPIAERTFECWYLQGQSAEILGDCPSLLAAWRQFTEMASVAALPQTWVYPPEGPAICVTPPP